MRHLSLLSIAALTGCASGDWAVSAWGEEYIEEGIPAEEFVDSCSASFERFSVEFAEASLRTPEEEIVGEVPVGRFELTEPGPQDLGAVSVTPGTYDRVYYSIGSETEDSVQTAGTVTCGEDSVAFDWSFNPSVRYRCLADAPLEVVVPEGGEVATQITIHGDHLFYDSLAGEGEELRGQAIVDADADADGVVTLAELEAVSVEALGYPVGTHTEITHLADFIAQLVSGVGHVDGEGHCYVD
jgi:hypothetical protein